MEKDELYHHGIKGQKWGVRRFQNEDGTRTPAGEKRYSKLAKTAGKVAKTAANIATLGAVGDIERAEKSRNKAKKSYGVTPRSGATLGLRLVGRGANTFWDATGTAIITSMAASGIMSMALNHAMNTGDTRVLKGAAVASTVLAGMGAARMATIAGYNTVAGARDIRNYVVQPKKEDAW